MNQLQSTNPFFTDLEYQKYCLEVFEKEYKHWSNLAIMSKEGTWYTFKKPKFSLYCAMQNYMKRGEVFAASPASFDTTHMAWFDLDAHSDDVTKQKDAQYITKKIYDCLTNNNVYPEFVQSSTVGNYHLRIRFEYAQNNQLVMAVQRGLLYHLGLPRSIEFGPKNKRQIRPWFVGNHFKPAGIILHKGQVCNNLKDLMKFHNVGQELRNEHVCEVEADFNIEKYIPDGLFMKRNCALMHLVEDCVRFGYSKEKILDYAKEIYARGVVKDALEKHLLSFEGIYSYYVDRFSFWDTFWNSFPKGKTVSELIEAMRSYAKEHNLISFPLSVRVVANYQGVSVRTAWKRLKEHNETHQYEYKLNIYKRGSRYRSTRYNVF